MNTSLSGVFCDEGVGSNLNASEQTMPRERTNKLYYHIITNLSTPSGAKLSNGVKPL